MYAQRHSTSLFGDPYLAGLAAFGMVWGGFALCESVDHCREVLRSLRFEHLLVWFPALVCLLVLIMQTACLGIIIAAFAGTMRRYSWGAPFGFVAAIAITGLSFAWTPILSSLSGLGGFLYHLFDLGWRSLIRNSLRLFVDVSVFLIVPAYLVFAFRGQMDSALRRDQPRALLLVLAAGTLGWSVHALLKVFLQLSALYTVLDFAGMNASLPLRFWMAGLGKMGCLVAVLVLLAAGAGMFLRQPWAIATALFASAAFLAIELVFLIVEIMPRENGMPVGFGGHLLRGLTPLIIPGILCGLSIYLKDEV